MTIIAHPLTQLDGSPQYTASDYRKSVNALLLPSDGTAFGSVQGVRAGSPSPLIAINGTTVTIKAHAGVLCPWAGVGAYTYEMDTDTSVAVTDTTGTYKIALVLSDPSQSHGTTPGLALQSFPGSTADSAIQGLVIGRVVAGVPSDLAPRLLQQTLISVSTLSILQTIPGAEGQRAKVTSDATSANNGEYRYTNGAWSGVPRVVAGSTVVTPNSAGTAASLWSSAAFQSAFGISAASESVFIGAMNGDSSATSVSILNARINQSTGDVDVTFSSSPGRTVRVNWMVLLPK